MNESKNFGNEYFQKKDYKMAIQCYEKGLTSIAFYHYNHSPNADLYGNISECLFRLEKFEESLFYCFRAYHSDENSIKASPDSIGNFTKKLCLRSTKIYIQLKITPAVRICSFICYLNNDQIFHDLLNEYKFKIKYSKICNFCAKFQMDMKKCSKCRVYYCSVDCQKKDWVENNHKIHCKQ